jgi:hypothetical protein
VQHVVLQLGVLQNVVLQLGVLQYVVLQLGVLQYVVLVQLGVLQYVVLQLDNSTTCFSTICCLQLDNSTTRQFYKSTILQLAFPQYVFLQLGFRHRNESPRPIFSIAVCDIWLPLLPEHFAFCAHFYLELSALIDQLIHQIRSDPVNVFVLTF